MQRAIVFDCEFLTAEGAPSRFWCGPQDPDPVVVQIGAVAIGLDADFPLLDSVRIAVIPRSRGGARVMLDPFFTRLTGVTEAVLDQTGLSLSEALDRVCDFAAGKRLWSWGKDEFNMVAISCFVAGMPPPLPATQFGNACHLLLKAGMPLADLQRTASHQLATYFHLPQPPLQAHDALHDALSLASVIQHLLRNGALKPADLD